MREFTLGELRNRLEKLTDTVGDRHLDEDEKNEIIASAAAETWDKIINAGLAEQFVKKVSFTSVGNQVEYPIEGETDGIITNGDFYKVAGLVVDEGNNYFRPIERINPSEVTGLTAPSQVVNLVLYYIPRCTDFEDENGSFDDDETFDGINGWEEHTLMTAAIAVCLKKDKDDRQFYNRKQDLEKRIAAMANTDWSGPSRVVKRWRKRRDPWMPFTNGLTCYAIRGGKLELYIGGPLYGYPTTVL